MNNKFLVKICTLIIIIFLLIFLFYLLFIKPVIVGTYIPTTKECFHAYDCKCLKGSCICTYRKWGKENKLTCEKDILKEYQIK